MNKNNKMSCIDEMNFVNGILLDNDLTDVTGSSQNGRISFFMTRDCTTSGRYHYETTVLIKIDFATWNGEIKTLKLSLPWWQFYADSLKDIRTNMNDELEYILTTTGYKMSTFNSTFGSYNIRVDLKSGFLIFSKWKCYIPTLSCLFKQAINDYCNKLVATSAPYNYFN
jgi:hypothetical protein